MIERTFDYRIVKKIAGEVPVISSQWIYLIDEDRESVWAFEKYLDGLMIHVSALKIARGKKTVQSAKLVFKWLEDKDFKNIYACIARELKHVCNFSIAIGMRFTHSETRKIGTIDHKIRCYKIILGA